MKDVSCNELTQTFFWSVSSSMANLLPTLSMPMPALSCGIYMLLALGLTVYPLRSKLLESMLKLRAFFCLASLATFPLALLSSRFALAKAGVIPAEPTM